MLSDSLKQKLLFVVLPRIGFLPTCFARCSTLPGGVDIFIPSIQRNLVENNYFLGKQRFLRVSHSTIRCDSCCSTLEQLAGLWCMVYVTIICIILSIREIISSILFPSQKECSWPYQQCHAMLPWEIIKQPWDILYIETRTQAPQSEVWEKTQCVATKWMTPTLLAAFVNIICAIPYSAFRRQIHK